MDTKTTGSVAARSAGPGEVMRFETPHGHFDVKLNTERAPVTSRYFRGIVEAGLYRDSSIYRITTPDNDARHSGHPIRIIQGGLKFSTLPPVPPVDLESTAASGLAHRRWSFSTARFARDCPYGAFFICMEDSPCLDLGGGRSEDGLGFAVCGAVVAGFQTLGAIYACAEATDFLQKEIPITAVSIVNE